MKKRILSMVLALAAVVSLLTVPAAAASTDSGIYGIRSLAMSAELTPQTEDNQTIPAESRVIDGAQEQFYPGAVRFALTFTGTPNAMYFVRVVPSGASAYPYVNQYTADGSGKVLCTGRDAPYPQELTAGTSYEVYANNVRIAEFRYGDGKAAPEQFALYGASMVAGNDLSMNFYIKTADLQGREDVYAQITRTYAGDRQPETLRIPCSEWLTKSKDLKYVTYAGLAAKEMMDSVTVQIFANDVTALSKPYEDSIHDYALRMLGKEKNPAKLKTLLADMVNYGAEAQKQFHYAEDRLANHDLGEYSKFATENVTPVDTRTKAGNYRGTSLSAEANIQMTIYFLKETPGLHAVVRYTDHYGHPVTKDVPSSEFTHRGDLYGINIAALATADVHTMVTCEVQNSNGEVIGSCTDSMESYIARMSTKSTIMEAMMKFGVSAYAYFHN